MKNKFNKIVKLSREIIDYNFRDEQRHFHETYSASVSVDTLKDAEPYINKYPDAEGHIYYKLLKLKTLLDE